MGVKVRDTLRYIVRNYPYPSDLTKTRVTKLVYLADWFMVEEHGRQITNIKWFFDHYGPYVSDVLDAADDDKNIRILETQSSFGTVKYIVQSKVEKQKLKYSLSDEEIEILNKVIEETKSLTWNDFISYVYETSPVKNTKKYNNLNLFEEKVRMKGK